MTTSTNYAKKELDILKQISPDAIVLEYEKEILSLYKAFNKSGQSGASAPYTATIISNTLKKLLLHTPISDITGNDDEWLEISDNLYQNVRCAALFKQNDKYNYIDAIVWKNEDNLSFTGRVYIDDKDFKLISSSLYVKSFPFTPKTFYIDVIDIKIEKQEAESKNIHYYEDINGDCHYTIVKNPDNLKEVFQYYNID
jgi:hypothetical protein